MEYNQPSQIVKDLNFGEDGKNRIMSGVDKLATAVKSTLGASGRCVMVLLQLPSLLNHF